MALNRAELLNAMRLNTELVDIPGGQVIVSEIGAADYINIWTDPENQKDGAVNVAKFTPALVACSVVDEEGNRLFSDDDVTAIARSSHSVFLILSEAARRINGLIGEEQKNLDPSPEEHSVSASA